MISEPAVRSARQLLNDFNRKDLEEEFYKNCEALDTKAAEIIKLEQKILYLQSRYSRFMKEKNGTAPIKPKMSSNQYSAKELQDQVALLEQVVVQKQVQCDKITKQVQYFRQMKKIHERSTVDAMIEISNFLYSSQSLPNLSNQLRAISSILKNNYGQAEFYLRSLIDPAANQISLSESFSRRKEIRDREAKIEELRTNLSILQKRYSQMDEKHQKMFEAYQIVAQQNSKKSEKVTELQRRKEIKLMESQKATEFEAKTQALRTEIECLRIQKQKLTDQNNEHHNDLEHEIQNEFQKLQKGISDLESECKNLSNSNDQIESQFPSIQSELDVSKQNRNEAEVEFHKAQEEYKEVMAVFGKIMEHADNDPFNDSQFVDYLKDMAQKNLVPERIKTFTDKIEAIDLHIEKINSSIDKQQQEQNEISQRIETKRQQVTRLDQQLRILSALLDGKDDCRPKEKMEFVEGAPNANFEENEINAATEGKNAIIIVFRDFQLAPEFIGLKPSQIFISVNFLEHQSLTTSPVDPKSGMFNESLCFICQNDFILKDYILKSVVPIQLCRTRDSNITETGTAEINLSPFIENKIQKFTSYAKIWNNAGRAVGKVTFEAAILKEIP